MSEKAGGEARRCGVYQFLEARTKRAPDSRQRRQTAGVRCGLLTVSTEWQDGRRGHHGITATPIPRVCSFAARHMRSRKVDRVERAVSDRTQQARCHFEDGGRAPRGEPRS